MATSREWCASPAFSPRRGAQHAPSQAQHGPSTPSDPHRRRGSASNCARAHRTSPRKTPREWQRGAAAQHHTFCRPVSPLHFSPPLPLSSLQESVQTFGRKKTAVAVSYCKKGRGLIKINGCPIELVEPEVLRYKVFEPILLLGRERFANMDIRIRVKGGGYTSQIYAIRQAIAKSVVAYYQKCAPRLPTPPLSAAPPLAPSPLPLTLTLSPSP